MSLSGKRVVVLGASVGIGLAVAAAAREQGADVLIVSSRKERLDRALKSLPTTGVAGQIVDLSDEPQVQALFERAGAFDHLVFTAGEKLHLEPLANMQLDAARGFFKLRFWVHSWRRSMVALISGPEVQLH
jgi:NAD(P)-dependent dehydrogenase (short-subunit alcohol dehydrogenase family)